MFQIIKQGRVKIILLFAEVFLNTRLKFIIQAKDVISFGLIEYAQTCREFNLFV